MSEPPATELRRDLQSRHIAMISIGGIIGSGLFIGSSAAIAAVGPAVVVSYALAGVLVLVVMRVLAAMAEENPAAGSFTEYVRVGLGDSAGFVAGWLYWYFWVLAIALEAVAGASILRNWIDLPVWQMGFGLLAVLTAVNLVSTRAFGETEFWLSGLKVAALLAFILIGGAWLFGSGASPGVSNLTVAGGFAPFGAGAVLAGAATVVFALVGAEIVAVAAAESKEPGRTIARMTTALVIRISLFYLVSMALIVAMVPWSEIRPGDSPFAMALDRVGIPGVAQMMNALVLVAALSCLNAGFYVSSRVLFTLADRGDAPRALVRLNARGVPVRAVLLSTVLAALGLVASIWFPEGIFSFLVNASGTVILLIYAMLVLGYLRGGTGRPGLVVASWASLAGIAAILVSMGLDPAVRPQLIAGLALTLVTALAALLRQRMRKPQ